MQADALTYLLYKTALYKFIIVLNLRFCAKAGTIKRKKQHETQVHKYQCHLERWYLYCSVLFFYSLMTIIIIITIMIHVYIYAHVL